MSTLAMSGESVLDPSVSSLPVDPKSNDYGNIHSHGFATLNDNQSKIRQVIHGEASIPSSPFRCSEMFCGGGWVGIFERET